MGSSLEQILADVDQLDAQEQLKVVAHVITGLQQKPYPSSKNQFSRKDLFGCLRGQIAMSADFNSPLSDFAEYM
jgi:hypothetical protein